MRMGIEIFMQYEIDDMHIDCVRWIKDSTKIFHKNIMMVFGKFNWNTVIRNGVLEQDIIDQIGLLNDRNVIIMLKIDLHLQNKKMDFKIFIEQAKEKGWYKEIDYDKMTEPNWKDVIVLSQWKCMGIEFKVVFYTLWHPCAYIRIPEKSELYWMSYWDAEPCTCHWWFTFWAFWWEKYPHINEWYWLGWDYGHYDDYSKIYESIAGLKHNKKWTTEEILEDVFNQIIALKNEGKI